MNFNSKNKVELCRNFFSYKKFIQVLLFMRNYKLQDDFSINVDFVIQEIALHFSTLRNNDRNFRFIIRSSRDVLHFSHY